MGPGADKFMTPQAIEAIDQSQIIIGYKFYIDLIKHLLKGKETFDTGMKKEQQRAAKAFSMAKTGKTVAVISSGDSGVYGMASLLWEMKIEENIDTELEVVAGISAMMATAAKMGAPLGHDFCSISMSDLLTPWRTIEKRIEAAASADFITAIYNPKSNDRFWQLERLRQIFLQYRALDTPVGIGRQVGRQDEEISITTLQKMDVNSVDMFTVVIIGNSQSFSFQNKIITPRGYYNRKKENNDNIGRKIMNESFKKILSKLDSQKYSLEHLWVALHGIHTTADFSIADILKLSPKVIHNLHYAFYSGKPPVIITDVNMVTQGIRKAIAKELGIEIICYLNNDETINLAKHKGITRTQAGIQLAVKEHPNALYAFGNAPTALIELVKHIRNKKAMPIGVVAAPVGFVNVRESKWQLEYGCPNTPHVIVSGNKGGSNIAATIINSILSWNEAKDMHPGKGL